MKGREADRFERLLGELAEFEKSERVLPGIQNEKRRAVFVRQVIDSIRRVEYVYVIQERDISDNRKDPTANGYDPVMASIYFQRSGMVEEAFWQVFLAVHFGKAKDSGWRLARDIYGRLGEEPYWTWDLVSETPGSFSEWLADHYDVLTSNEVVRKFGNHRKYESLKPSAPRFTGKVIESYVKWIGGSKSHQQFFEDTRKECGDDPRITFDTLFRSMGQVLSFGRTGAFDYLVIPPKKSGVHK